MSTDLTKPTTLWHRFADVVARQPGHVAVHDHTRAWTYAELHARAEAIAAHLDDADASQRVACALTHGGEMVAGVLGVLASGRAYVPLDPTHPRDRSSFVLRDSGARTLLCDHETAAFSAELGGDVHALRTDAAIAGRSPRRRPQPTDLAYCLYTSGSTGRPKGVLQTHAHVVHLLDAYARRLELAATDVVTLLSTFAFDAAVVDVFATLLAGATLCPYDLRARGLAELPAMLAERGVTIYHSTPTVWREVVALVPGVSDTIRAVVLGGEEVLPSDVACVRAACAPTTVLVNGYGMTECSWALLNVVRPGDPLDRPTVALGTPLEGVRVTLKTPFGIQRTVHGVGTICIESSSVALGYHARPEETAVAFPAPNTYLTTDLGRLLPGGQIEFAGRQAHQAKLRGFRIDLREIEAVLASHPDVREAAARVHDGPRGAELVGYVTVREDHPAPEQATLREHLAARLPDYMLPAVFVPLPALPRGATGKLDRGALPPPDATAFVHAAYVAPRTPQEVALAELWRELLRAERVGVHDTFFNLGGSSLLALRLAARVHARLGVELPVRVVFERPALEEMAAYLAQAPTGSTRRLQYARTDVTTLRAGVPHHYFYYLDRDDHDPASYYMGLALELEGPLDTMRFAQAYDELVASQGAYRTAFQEVDGALVQIVLDPGEARPPALEVVDRSGLSRTELPGELERAQHELTAAGYDLATGTGLVRGRLIRTAPDHHALLVLRHHIAGDGGEAGALIRHLLEGYQRLRDGASSSLPSDPPLQLVDFLHARQQWEDSAVGRAQHAVWVRALEGASPVELEGDFPRGPIDARRDAAPFGVTADRSYPPEKLQLPDDVYAAVLAAAEAMQTTTYVVFAAGLAWLLHERSGQDDITVQTTYSARAEDPVLARVHGCLTAWSLIRADLRGATSFAEAIRRTKRFTDAMFDEGPPRDYYAMVPHGLRRVVFNYLPVGGGGDGAPPSTGELMVRRLTWPFPPWKRPWDLHLTLMDTGASAWLVWTGCEQLFRRETVAALLRRYVDVLGTRG